MIEFDLSRVKAELQVVFPALGISSPLRVLGSGFNSVVIEVETATVFRIGKNSIAQRGYEKEHSCLSLLAPNIPFHIPNPKWYARSSTYFPFGVIGYDKIAGVPVQPNPPDPLNLNWLAHDTAKFLFALHCLSPHVLPLKPAPDPVSKWESQSDKVLPVLQAELTATEFGVVKRWWDDFLVDPEMQNYNPVIQHGDLWYENMLVNPDLESLTGVIDWEKLSIGDRAQDFATLLHLGEGFARRVIEAYQSLGGELDEKFEHRLQRLWEAREFDGLDYAIQFDDPLELKDALWKLRRGPILEFLS